MEGDQWKAVASCFLFVWMENLVTWIIHICMSCFVEDSDMLNHCDISLSLKLTCMCVSISILLKTTSKEHSRSNFNEVECS